MRLLGILNNSVLLGLEEADVSICLLMLRSKREQVMRLDLVQYFDVQALLVAEKYTTVHQELYLILILKRCHKVCKVCKLINLL